jgi:enterochelin esterase-like enzyme
MNYPPDHVAKSNMICKPEQLPGRRGVVAIREIKVINLRQMVFLRANMAKRKPVAVRRGREEAAPTFETWRARLEAACAKQSEARKEVQTQTAAFLEVLKALGTPMIDEPTAHFVYYGPTARSVAIAGEFTQWAANPIEMAPIGDSGFFHYSHEFSGPIRIEYKIVVDGSWIADPFCPNRIDNGVGGENSYFVIGDVREPPEVQWLPEVPHGEVEEFDFDSQLLGNQRRVYVYLPADYKKKPQLRFPAMYVHDGGEYMTRANLPVILDNLAHSGAIVPLVAVMVDPVDRGREYRANEDYARFTEEELLPEIERRYRTQTDRDGRGVMGASLGGLISIYLGLSRPQLFSKIGGQSAALMIAIPTITPLIERLETPGAFYFDVGEYEPRFIPAHKTLVPMLEDRGCRCMFQVVPAGHNWTSWRAHLKELLTFLWPKAEQP